MAGKCKLYLLTITHSALLVRTDKCFVSFSTCNPNTCSHWLTQSQKEAEIYYLFIIGWHTLYFSSYWLSFIDLSLLHMSRLGWKLVLVENYTFVTSNRGWYIYFDILSSLFSRLLTKSSSRSPSDRRWCRTPDLGNSLAEQGESSSRANYALNIWLWSGSKTLWLVRHFTLPS